MVTGAPCNCKAPMAGSPTNEPYSYIERKQFNLFTVATERDGIAVALDKTA